MIGTILVDDERLARVELRRLLEAHADIRILGEASHVEEALSVIAQNKPDLVFLDIQMPGATGFDLLERMEGPLPEIVFVTAYDEYAIRAFEFNALDYLLKPIDPARLAEALTRARNSVCHAPDEPASTEPSHKLKAADRVFLRDGDHCWFLPVSDIILIESDGNYSIVKFAGHSPMLPRSLSSLEERLDPNLFFRANRSQLINLQKVLDVDLWFSGSLKVKMEGGTVVELSRRQAAAFRERLSL
ncbi:MAG: response regulator [Opitutales bacterium]|jgi:two-component system LytT family response regulator